MADKYHVLSAVWQDINLIGKYRDRDLVETEANPDKRKKDIADIPQCTAFLNLANHIKDAQNKQEVYDQKLNAMPRAARNGYVLAKG